MGLFQRKCSHLWRVIKQETQPSGIETLQAAGCTEFKGVAPSLLERPVIVTYQCAKCSAEQVKRV